MIEAINSGKPFRCADIRVPKGYINPWLIYRDSWGSWFHYSDCETAMDQQDLRQMLHDYFHSENWQIKKDKWPEI